MRISRIALFLLCSCIAQPLQAAEMVAGESEVQAAFLFNFALFTEWPVLENKQINICVMAGEKVFQSLQPYKLKQVRGNGISLKQITAPAQISGCQMVYVGKAEHRSIREVAKQIDKESVMLVAEENSFDPNHAMIVLVPKQDRIAFKINQTLAQGNAVSISSRLLKLAQQVY